MHGFTASVVEAPLAFMSGDPDRPIFTTDMTSLRTQNGDIIWAFKDGRVDERWFDYLLSDINFRSSIPPPGFLPVYTWAFTTWMTLPVHPFVKDFCLYQGISPAQLVPNFWYCFASAWVLWSLRFDVDLLLDGFLYIYKLSHVTKCKGWYFLCGHGLSKPILGKLIQGIPSYSHGWKLMFFMVRGPFNFHPKDRMPHHWKVQTSFRRLSENYSKWFFSFSLFL